MVDWIALGRVADVLIIFAALLAFFGALATWLSRPRLKIEPVLTGRSTSTTILVRHEKGMLPARNVRLRWAALNVKGAAVRGDGESPWMAEMYPGSYRTLVFYDATEHFFADSPDPRFEHRQEVPKSEGILIEVSWQRTVLSWLRVRRVIVWAQADRIAMHPPKVMRGLVGATAFDRATRVKAG